MARLYGKEGWIFGIVIAVLGQLSNAQFQRFNQGFGRGRQWDQRSMDGQRGSSRGPMSQRSSRFDFNNNNNNGPRFQTGRMQPQTRVSQFGTGSLSGQLGGGPQFITRQQPTTFRSSLPQQQQQVQQQQQHIPQFATATAPIATAPVAAEPQPDITSLLSRIASALPAPVAKPPPSVPRPPAPAVASPATAVGVNPMTGMGINPMTGMGINPMTGMGINPMVGMGANPMAGMPGMGANPFGMGPMVGGMPFGPFAGIPGMIMSPLGPMTYDTYEDIMIDPDMPDRRRRLFGAPGMPLGGGPPPLSVPGSVPGVLAPPLGGAASIGFPATGSTAPAMTPVLQPLNPARTGGVVAPDPAGAPKLPAGVDQSTIQAALRAALARVNQPKTG